MSNLSFITEESYVKLGELPKTRKPYSNRNVKTVIDYHSLEKDVKEIINKLPVVPFQKSFFEENLDGDAHRFYIMINEEFGTIYFVDTQGYNYARYVSELVFLYPKEDVRPSVSIS
jgi:hypothetical protein